MGLGIFSHIWRVRFVQRRAYIGCPGSVRLVVIVQRLKVSSVNVTYVDSEYYASKYRGLPTTLTICFTRFTSIYLDIFRYFLSDKCIDETY